MTSNDRKNQLIILRNMIGERSFIKRYSYDGYYYNDSVEVENFTVDDFRFYAQDILNGDIELKEIKFTGDFGSYYLITFNDLTFIM